MIHVIKLRNEMSQLLVTSAPVIYIFPLLEGKAAEMKASETCRHRRRRSGPVGSGPRCPLPLADPPPPWAYADETESHDLT